MNMKSLLKRVCAYTIDLAIVFIFASLVSTIPILSKLMEPYEKTYDEYLENYNEYNEYLTLLKESYEDDEINEEEYTKLIENENYKEIITSKYEDNKITKGEYKKIVEHLNKEQDKITNNYNYLLNKKGISNSIIVLICTFLYFGIFQYLLKGQTIGKKLLKLKVVSASNKNITIINFILRSLIVNEVIFNTISIMFLITTKKNIYTHANNIVGILISISEFLIIYLVLTREDERGIHDLLFNTKVINIEEPLENIKDNNIEYIKDNNNSKDKKIIEAEYKEEKTNGKEKSKSSRKRKK